MKSKSEKNNKEGFVVVIAILVSTALLIITSSLSTITLRQLKLSKIGAESSIALNAASSGVECALYWERHSVKAGFETFPTDTFGEISIEGQPEEDKVTCANGGEIITGDGFPAGQDFTSPWGQGRSITRFRIAINNPVNGLSCADIKVVKGVRATEWIYIDSKGYSTCDLSDPDTVSRSIVIRLEK